MERFHAVFQHVDGWWIGWTEELPGANAQARTLDEARDDLREAIRLILEVNRELAESQSIASTVMDEAAFHLPE